ncbi:hypothetical protein VTK73DRAFT_6199 [Phialemonium thermophilum]|uniref:Uncharacterized protein n=1 Tax=Phialemonium thermophilum TaxID=223376 RepID=A0ABR3V0H6_9PEZI
MYLVSSARAACRRRGRGRPRSRPRRGRGWRWRGGGRAPRRRGGRHCWVWGPPRSCWACKVCAGGGVGGGVGGAEGGGAAVEGVAKAEAKLGMLRARGVLRACNHANVHCRNGNGVCHFQAVLRDEVSFDMKQRMSDWIRSIEEVAMG